MRKTTLLLVLLSLLVACSNNNPNIGNVGEERYLLINTLIVKDAEYPIDVLHSFVESSDEYSEEGWKSRRNEIANEYGLLAPVGSLVKILDKTEDGMICKVKPINNDFVTWKDGFIGWVRCDSFNEVVN